MFSVSIEELGEYLSPMTCPQSTGEHFGPVEGFHCQRHEVIPRQPLFFRDSLIDTLCYFYGGHYFAAVSVIGLRQLSNKCLWIDLRPGLSGF